MNKNWVKSDMLTHRWKMENSLGEKLQEKRKVNSREKTYFSPSVLCVFLHLTHDTQKKCNKHRKRNDNNTQTFNRMQANKRMPHAHIQTPTQPTAMANKTRQKL